MSAAGRGGRHRPGGGRHRHAGDRRRREGRRRRGGDDPRRPPLRLRPDLRGAAARSIPTGEAEIVVNLQGDFPTIAPDNIRAALPPLADPAVDIATLAAEIHTEEERTNPNVVKVVGSPIGPRRLRALYFTRATAPYGDGPRYHHIGLYAYRRAALERFVALPPSPLEQREKLEQLRALEAGMRIDVAIVDTVPLGVDTPADLETARAHTGQSLNRLLKAQRRMTKKLKIAFQGEPGANSHIAIVEAYPDAEPLPCPTFEDAFAAISSGEADLGMIPIENSVAGRVADIHHLLPHSGLLIVGEWFLPIHHQLMAPRGAKLADIKTVESHVHALGQCRRIIRKLGIKPIVAADTAGGARDRRRARRQDAAPRSPRGSPPKSTASISWPRTSRTRPTTPRASSCWRARRTGPSRARARWSPLSFSGCATCRPRSTRRWAASPPTAST